ncbi:MAG: ankyrin repeat domain-containing protein [Pirellulales bacterium]
MTNTAIPKLFCLLALIMVAQSSRADENWPSYRGPHANGVAPDNAGLPTNWTLSNNVKWVADVPGWGWSCPVVWGDKVFLTTVVSEEENLTPSKGLYLGQGVRDPAKGIHHWLVYCFDLNTGQQLWKQESHAGLPVVPRHPKSTYAVETPVTDGERLYVLFGDLGLYCYDFSGKSLWSKPIEPKKTFQDYGAAASPVIHDDQLFVVYDNKEQSWIASFDTKSGDENWRTQRDETHSWATPLVWKNKQRTEIVVPGKKKNRSYSLDGEVLWEFDGQMSNLVIPSPLAAHDMCFIASGYIGDAHRPTFAIKPGASGDITPEEEFTDSEYIAWYQGKSSSYNPSQIIYGDYLYTLYDRGFLTCHNARTGEEVYGKQRFEPRGSFTSSPWAYNGKLFFLSEDGLTYTVKAGPDFEILSTSDLEELSMSTPAIAGDKLLIRTGSALYCLSEGAKLAPEIAAARAKRKPATTLDIWTAAAEGNQISVLSNLVKGVSVNAKNPAGGATPLMEAALHGNNKIAKLLIEKGADLSLRNRDGNTALHMAAFVTNTEIVTQLLNKGADVNVKNNKGDSPLSSISTDWNPKLEDFYQFVSEALSLDLDLKNIQTARPKIAKMLREHQAN